MNKSIVIYKISFPNNKVYIGQTRNFKARMNGYKRSQCKSQKLLYNALNKYGFDSCEVSILCKGLDQESAHIVETNYIKLYQSNRIENGYNIRLGQLQGGYSHTEETKLKMSIYHKANPNTGSWQKGQTPFNKGVPLKEEIKQKLSKLNERYLYTIFYTNGSTEQTTNLKLYSIDKGWPQSSLPSIFIKGNKSTKYGIDNIQALDLLTNKIINNKKKNQNWETLRKNIYSIVYNEGLTEETDSLKDYAIAKGWLFSSLYPLVNKSFNRNKYNIKEVISAPKPHE